MKNHLDEATLQGYFDNELPRAMAERAAMHLTTCSTCAEAAREMESEIAVLATALRAEFDSGVPTERLRRRIDLAIADLPDKRARPYHRQSWFGVVGFFTGSSPRALRYAVIAVIMILAAGVGVIYLRRGAGTALVEIARKDPPSRTADLPGSPEESGSPRPDASSAPTLIVASAGAPKNTGSRHSISPERDAKFLPGERDYIKTIAALAAQIKSDAQPIRPGLQVEYAHNLAVVNQAIATTRVAVKKNPDDPDMTQFLFSAYQSKVNLLTQVADARRFNQQGK